MLTIERDKIKRSFMASQGPLFDFSGGSPASFVEILSWRACQQPDLAPFTFLLDGEEKKSSLSFAELNRQARVIASALQGRGIREGDRALLLYPPGLSYISAFFGCLYAGVIAIPVSPPRNQRNTPRVLAILKDAQPKVALGTASVCSGIQTLLTKEGCEKPIDLLPTDVLEAGIGGVWRQPSITRNTIAFLQYTSGSTGNPRGVMLSHANLIHNSEGMRERLELSSETIGVSWLPPYHDMGLIAYIMQPVYLGCRMTLMSPATFLQRPFRWLNAISRVRATISGGPNFAYDICLRTISTEQRETLDLSSWSIATNGAEPVRKETIDRFTEAFGPCGFQPEAFYPCYGLAEATLFAAGGKKSALPLSKSIQVSFLEQNQVVGASEGCNASTLVGCGRSLPDQKIVIVNVETGVPCEPGEIGEIWISGPSIAQGYWNRSEETTLTFQARLSDNEGASFLRTGDLGFLQGDELYVTGRVKDLMIFCGRNIYPQDIESTAERSHPDLRVGSGAAFSVRSHEEDELVIVQELDFRKRPNIDEVVKAIRKAVAEEHGIRANVVEIVHPGTVPKTTSGKIQRLACREQFLAGELGLYLR